MNNCLPPCEGSHFLYPVNRNQSTIGLDEEFSNDGQSMGWPKTHFCMSALQGSTKLVGLIASSLRNSKAVTRIAETHKHQISEVRYGKLLLLLRKWKEYCVRKATWNLIQTLVSSAKTPSPLAYVTPTVVFTHVHFHHFEL